jgi:aminomethyltransferase
MSLKRTPLHAAHGKLGGRLVGFGGWEMPVQYTSITEEHLRVRNAAGVFDIAHMGEVVVEGPAAEEFLNSTLTNDVRRLAVGLGQYTQMCLETGGTVDDLYLYRLAASRYLLIINAGRIDADLACLRARLAAFPGSADVVLGDLCDGLGAVAVQGPRVAGYIDGLFPGAAQGGAAAVAPSALAKNQIALWRADDAEHWVARTGYTGEDGFEIVVQSASLEALWSRVLEAGRDAGILPCGLGARDTLRTEACFPLYGHELDEDTSPIEAGLGVFVAFDKGPFVGREALLRQKESGPARRSAAFRMTGKSAPPRPGYPIFAGGTAVGTVASGTQSPTLNCGIGMGFLPPSLVVPGTRLQVEIRGQRHDAEVVKKPFYRRA